MVLPELELLSGVVGVIVVSEFADDVLEVAGAPVVPEVVDV
jgi:hypothetical protein